MHEKIFQTYNYWVRKNLGGSFQQAYFENQSRHALTFHYNVTILNIYILKIRLLTRNSSRIKYLARVTSACSPGSDWASPGVT